MYVPGKNVGCICVAPVVARRAADMMEYTVVPFQLDGTEAGGLRNLFNMSMFSEYSRVHLQRPISTAE
jgi:hypothetical protein